MEEQQAGRGRPPREELTGQQLEAIARYIERPNQRAVAEELGLHPKTLSRWLAAPRFRAEYLKQLAERQLETWNQMISKAPRVWERFEELLEEDPAIAIRAVTWHIDRMLTVPAIVRSELGGARDVVQRLEERMADLADLIGSQTIEHPTSVDPKDGEEA